MAPTATGNRPCYYSSYLESAALATKQFSWTMVHIRGTGRALACWRHYWQPAKIPTSVISSTTNGITRGSSCLASLSDLAGLQSNKLIMNVMKCHSFLTWRTPTSIIFLSSRTKWNFWRVILHRRHSNLAFQQLLDPLVIPTELFSGSWCGYLCNSFPRSATRKG